MEDGTGRGEPGWDRAEGTADGWVKLEGGREER